MKYDRIYYRGDKEIYKKAKAQAAQEGKTVSKFIDEAIAEKLNKKKGGQE